jgi:Ser/Thr protein kinase RdoA (MazF antagonist)
MAGFSVGDVQPVLALANERHATRWQIVRRLAGGYQQGAYELQDDAGARAVLKWYSAHLPAQQLRATAQALESARVRGWPTPRWLAYAPLARGGAYIVEEFVAGVPPTQLEGTVLERLFDALRLQADARPQTDQDWSSYVHRVVFSGEAGLAARMRAHAQTSVLFERLESLVRDARDLRLPTDDLVHGDFVLNNMLVRDGQPYLVDAAHAGKGTRAYDVATLLMETTVGGDYATPSIADQRRLERHGVAIAGRLGFLVCVACRIMHLLMFGGDHWSDEVAHAVTKCESFLDSLESVRT